MPDVRPFTRPATTLKPSREAHQILTDLVTDLTTIALLDPPTLAALAHFAHPVAVRLRAQEASAAERGSE